MKRCRTRLALLIAMAFLVAVFGGCGQDTTTNPSGSAAPTDTSSEMPSPTPTVAVDPRADFIEGAKAFLSTDLVDLVTGEEDGKRFIGMLSDFLNDLNTRTAQTDLSLTLTDVNLGDETLDSEIVIGLNALHDAKSGDSSLSLDLGSGTEVATNVGIFITGDTAVLKPGSTKEKIMLYTMPAVNASASTFADKAMILLTGLFSDDGNAFALGDNLTDRQDLCDRYLDPWLTDTAQTDYSDQQITKTLAGREVELRAVTLNMSGQKAFDFVLSNLKKVQADAQFADMDRLLGGLMGFLSTDIYDLLQMITADDGNTADLITSAAGELIGELEALTPDEIAAAKFIVSILFNGDKPIGIDIEASTTGKAFMLDGIIYRSGYEHEVALHYQNVTGESASIELSTISAGGDNYNVNGELRVMTADGLESYSGGYTGTLTETDAQYDLTGQVDLAIQFFNDEDDEAGTGLISGDLSLNIDRDDAGYKGTGSLAFDMNAGDSATISLNIALDAALQFMDSVAITPPMYTSANVTTVKNKADLWAIHAADLGNMQDYGSVAQIVKLLLTFILG